MKKRLLWTTASIGVILLFLLFTFEFPTNFSWRGLHLPLSGRVIVIDPGHGGPDGGANNGGIQEKDIALRVAKYLRTYLEQQGAVVVMTRVTDTDLAPKKVTGLRNRKVTDLKERTRLINESRTDLFVSIHLNAIPQQQWRGAQTFYYSKNPANERIAKLVQDSLITVLKNTDRIAKPLDTVYLLRNAKKPGVLAEIGFLSNDEERQLLQNKKYEKKVAFAIYTGISRSFTEEQAPE